MKVKAELWWKAAGRCEFKGCNKPLYEHDITFDNCNLSNCAHIIADSPNGPRGTEQSKELAKEAQNIMLMCPECHKYIDHEGKDKYDADTLFEMKRHHEDRMKYLTGLSEDMQAHVVTYGSSIGAQTPDFNFTSLQKALLPQYYPTSTDIIHLGGRFYQGETWTDYWNTEISNLKFKCKDLIMDKIDMWEHKRIALFGFAPMPLLVYLGTLLNNKHNVEVYQRHRDTEDWCWKSFDEDIDYSIKRPQLTNKQPVLIISLSNNIEKRVRKQYSNDKSIWELSIANPNPCFLTSKAMLTKFGRKAEIILNEITNASEGTPINVHLSVPTACAIELGRVWMQKANSPLNIYDLCRKEDIKDKLAITIKN